MKKLTINLNPLISLFALVNPTYERLFPNKTQRKALERLVKKFGAHGIGNVIRLLPKINAREYAPVITTPLMLENKLGQLKAFFARERQRQARLKNKIKPGYYRCEYGFQHPFGQECGHSEVLKYTKKIA